MLYRIPADFKGHFASSRGRTAFTELFNGSPSSQMAR
jgi:hypothetical protein